MLAWYCRDLSIPFDSGCVHVQNLQLLRFPFTRSITEAVDGPRLGRPPQTLNPPLQDFSSAPCSDNLYVWGRESVGS